MSQQDYRLLIRDGALDENAFVQLTFKGKIGAELPWRLVTVRPVELKGGRRWQFSYFDARQDTTKNHTQEETGARLDELLALPFSSIQLRTARETLNVQITRKGKAILHREAAPAPREIDLSHDTAKALPIPADRPDPFLQAIGIMNADGRIRADMQGKFSQINEFIKLLEYTGALDSFDHSPIRILDCGCGSAHLTLAAYHYLNHIRGLPASLVGVDSNAALIDKDNAFSRELGLTDTCFYPSAIIDYQPDEPPDIVLALHACDTATDEALALAIRHEARVILAAPCCHHHLHQQLEARAPFEPVMRHGILKKRMGDILTDSLRAQVLRMMGYKTDVIEFISTEHTDRNLMIRAVRRSAAGSAAVVDEYRALKDFWGVTPYLETLLAAEMEIVLGGDK